MEERLDLLQGIALSQHSMHTILVQSMRHKNALISSRNGKRIKYTWLLHNLGRNKERPVGYTLSLVEMQEHAYMYIIFYKVI